MSISAKNDRLNIPEIKSLVVFGKALGIHAEQVILAQPEARSNRPDRQQPLPARSQTRQSSVFFFSCVHKLLETSREKINYHAPADNFQRGQNDREDQTNFRSMNDARGRVPMAHGKIERHRRGKEGEIKNQQRINGQRQGCAVIEYAMVFEALDLAFLLPHLQTGRTKMLAVQLTVAERAQEPAASLARDHGLLLGMIKATRFGVLQDRFARASGSKPPEERGKNFNLEPGTARGACREIREVKQISEQRSLAFRARNQRRIHWGLLAADDAGIANMIVEPALFTVECRHDVHDRTNEAAENF